MTAPKTDLPMSNADIVAVDMAAETARANGGGDVAVLDARKSKLREIRDRALKLAAIELSAAKSSAEVWGLGTKRANGILETAQAKHDADCKSARESYNQSLDAFMVDNGFLGMVGNDQALSVIGRRVDRAIASVVDAFNLAKSAGFVTVPTPIGRTWNVAEMLETLGTVNAIVAANPENSETVETAETSETSETVAA